MSSIQFRPKETDTPEQVLLDALADSREHKVDAVLVVFLRNDQPETGFTLTKSWFSNVTFGQRWALVGCALEKVMGWGTPA